MIGTKRSLRSSGRDASEDAEGRVCGLFAGVGGLEFGLHESGFRPAFLCEINPAAQAVLKQRFPGVPLHQDVTTLERLPAAEVVTAGFPCQDLSMAGIKVGIAGDRSGLVSKLLDLLEDASADPGRRPKWLVIENVPYMLHLHGGKAMSYIAERLEGLGYRWAYRVVDARAFGVPQRRLRVVLVASMTEDPRTVLFADDAAQSVDDSTDIVDQELAYGFYWTEGKRGLGWAVDGVPTIKGGSTIGIPSPPAIWIRSSGEIGTPDIRDLERLQGLPEEWTSAADRLDLPGFKNVRWNLVGNAVCASVAAWLGGRLRNPGDVSAEGVVVRRGARWPNAAWGAPGEKPRAMSVSTWPVAAPREPLRHFLHHPLKPLSARAATGYLKRAGESKHLCFPRGFLEAVEAHAKKMEAAVTPNERIGGRSRRLAV
jgi:DNA (cytosine-5)-methyltransferase 1